MAELGLRIMDRTIHDTNTWLQHVSDEMEHPDRQMAYHALKGVLHAVRDRLTVDEAHHLGAQLPTLIRGIYFESYVPAHKPLAYRDREPFLQAINDELDQVGGENPEKVAGAVFTVLSNELNEGIVTHVRQMLPDAVRQMWPEPVH